MGVPLRGDLVLSLIKRRFQSIDGLVAAWVERVDSRIQKVGKARDRATIRSEEHTSELQSLMRISYAVFCLKKKNKQTNQLRQLLYKLLSNTLYTNYTKTIL